MRFRFRRCCAYITLSIVCYSTADLERDSHCDFDDTLSLLQSTKISLHDAKGKEGANELKEGANELEDTYPPLHETDHDFVRRDPADVHNIKKKSYAGIKKVDTVQQKQRSDAAILRSNKFDKDFIHEDFALGAVDTAAADKMVHGVIANLSNVIQKLDPKIWKARAADKLLEKSRLKHVRARHAEELASRALLAKTLEVHEFKAEVDKYTSMLHIADEGVDQLFQKLESADKSLPDVSKALAESNATVITLIDDVRSAEADVAENVSALVEAQKTQKEAAESLHAEMEDMAEVAGLIDMPSISLLDMSNGSASNSSVSNSNLSNGSVSNTRVSNSSLSNGSVSNTRLSNSSLSNGSVSNGSLSKSSVSKIRVLKSRASNSSVSNGSMSNSSLSKSNVSKSSVSKSLVSNRSVSNGSVSNSSLSESSVSESSVSKSSVSNSSVSNSTVSNSTVSNSSMSSSRLSESSMADSDGIDVSDMVYILLNVTAEMAKGEDRMQRMTTNVKAATRQLELTVNRTSANLPQDMKIYAEDVAQYAKVKAEKAATEHELSFFRDFTKDFTLAQKASQEQLEKKSADERHLKEVLTSKERNESKAASALDAAIHETKVAHIRPLDIAETGLNATFDGMRDVRKGIGLDAPYTLLRSNLTEVTKEKKRISHKKNSPTKEKEKEKGKSSQIDESYAHSLMLHPLLMASLVWLCAIA